MVNKKGAESFTVILWIVVGVIVVGLFIYAYYNGFLPVLSGTKNLPKQMEIAIQACTALGGTPLDYSYCNDLRDTKDSGHKVTCQYLSEQKLVEVNKECKDSAGNVVTSNVLAKSLCAEQYKSNVANFNTRLKVNGVACSTLVTCEDIGGVEVAEATCPTDQTYTKVSKGLKDLRPTASCCVASA
ncbi:MAG: hypothetical protein Q8Q31_01340 [Nanoarchaeota archaeon]|nr:hypothetical protein [Nanoarchaeota archaeon]